MNRILYALICIVGVLNAATVQEQTDKCGKNDYYACEDLAHYYYNLKEYLKADRFYMRACDGGYYYSCYMLGLMYHNGTGVDKSYIKASEFYEKACYGGKTDACNNLGVLYNRGHGVRQNSQKAFELYSKACYGGNALGCSNLGLLYHGGRGVYKDYGKAEELYMRACNSQEALGCINLGDLYVEKKMTDKAYEYYGKACDLGNQDGCDKYKNKNNLNIN